MEWNDGCWELNARVCMYVFIILNIVDIPLSWLDTGREHIITVNEQYETSTHHKNNRMLQNAIQFI